MLRKTRIFKTARSMAGDTIIEVILAIAIIGVVLAAAYVSTGHSLQLGTDAGNRNRAVGIAQQQIERLKYVLRTSNNDVSQYAAQTTPFCVDPNGAPVASQTSGPNKDFCVVCTNSAGVTDSTQEFAGSAGCTNPGDRALYAVQIKYSNLIFTVNAQWPGPGGASYSTQTQYYKVPGINGVPAGNIGGGGPGPVNCFYNSTNTSVTKDTNVSLPYIAKYTAKINVNPTCVPVPITERQTFPGYPVIYYLSNCNYTAGGGNPYNPPNSTGPKSPNYDVVWDGGEYSTYTFYTKKNGDGCTITFTWKGWDVNQPNPIYVNTTLSIP